METEKETRICIPKIRDDLQTGRILDTGGAYLTAPDIVAQNMAQGKYDCQPSCPGLRSEPRRIGGIALPVPPREICGLEASLAETDSSQPAIAQE